MAVTICHEVQPIYKTKETKKQMTLQEKTLTTRLSNIIGDVTTYVAHLIADTYHDRWEEWTERMDDVTDEVNELNYIIGQLEEASKQRMLDKKLEEIDPERDYPSRVSALMGDMGKPKTDKKMNDRTLIVNMSSRKTLVLNRG